MFIAYCVVGVYRHNSCSLSMRNTIAVGETSILVYKKMRQ